jgi:hypothetical protein
MGIYILPKISKLLSKFDPQLATNMNFLGKSLQNSFKENTWTGRQKKKSIFYFYLFSWFLRAYLRDSFDNEYSCGNSQEKYENIYLYIYNPKSSSNYYISAQSQPWGILAGILNSTETEICLQNVENFLECEIGRRVNNKTKFYFWIVGIRDKPGDSLIWPAISQLYTWVLARTNPSKGWDLLR